MKAKIPFWVGAFTAVLDRPPANVWMVVDRRRNHGDPRVWERPVGCWPWLWLASLHARARAFRIGLSGTSPFVEREVMVTKGWVRRNEEPDSP